MRRRSLTMLERVKRVFVSGVGMNFRVVGIVCVVLGACVFTSSAAATPVATNDATYSGLGRVFPGPARRLRCRRAGLRPQRPGPRSRDPVHPVSGVRQRAHLHEREPESGRSTWRSRSSTARSAPTPPARPFPTATSASARPARSVFAGNNLPLEYDPKPAYKSAGLPTTTLGRDERRPDRRPRHRRERPRQGQEALRAVAFDPRDRARRRRGRHPGDGGPRHRRDHRALEQPRRAGEPRSPRLHRQPELRRHPEEDRHLLHLPEPRRLAPRLGDRGRLLLPALQRQRRRRQPRLARHRLLLPSLQRALRAREPRAVGATSATSRATPASSSAGDDLHGQPEADALSFTLLPHGSHNFEKDQRIRQTAIAIHNASEEALLWSPIIQPNDAPEGGGRAVRARWADRNRLRADLRPDLGHRLRHDQLHDDRRARRLLRLVDRRRRGRDRQRDVVLAPRQEHRLRAADRAAARRRQQGADLRPPRASSPGRASTASSRRQPGLRARPARSRATRRTSSRARPTAPSPRPTSARPGTAGADGNVTVPFTVKGGAPAGRRLAGREQERLQRRHARRRRPRPTSRASAPARAPGRSSAAAATSTPGVADDDDWVTVTEDYNQSPLYAQAGITAAVNRPQPFKADGTPVEWRAVISGNALGVTLPRQPDRRRERRRPFHPRARDHRWRDRRRRPGSAGRLRRRQHRLLRAAQPVHRRPGAEVPEARSARGHQRPAVARRDSARSCSPTIRCPATRVATRRAPSRAAARPPIRRSLAPAPRSRARARGPPGTFEEFPFTIGANEENAKVDVTINWADANDDFDLFVYKEEENGDRTEVASSASGGTTSESASVANPGAGNYVVVVDNFAARRPGLHRHDRLHRLRRRASTPAPAPTRSPRRTPGWRRSSSTSAAAATSCSPTAPCARCRG